MEDFHTYYVSEQKVLVHNTCATTTKNVTSVSNLSDNYTGTVWDNIKATQPEILGSSIPKSFELNVGKSKFWVHPNATKHIAEYPKTKWPYGNKIIEQQLLNGLHGVMSETVKRGYNYNEIIDLDDWEIIISMPGRTGTLPVIKHALYKP